MPGCYPYGVRAMWSERSRHMRGGAVLGSSGKVAGLAVRFLARDMRLTGAKMSVENPRHFVYEYEIYIKIYYFRLQVRPNPNPNPGL